MNLFVYQILLNLTIYKLSPYNQYNFINTQGLFALNNKMIESLVDYVLERGNKDYGQFAPRKQINQNNALFNHRKMLQYLFTQNKDNQNQQQKYQQNNRSSIKRISDMKAQQISGQLNYFSQKIHGQLSRKYINLDSDLFRLQNQWMKKKIPDFYCYYFLKFCYANSYSRIHQLILSQIQNITCQKPHYTIIHKTIQAREICLTNLRKQLTQLTQLDIQQSLQTIKQQNQMKLKTKREKGRNKEDNLGKSWKNKLENVFQAIQHVRKLGNYVVQLIKNWKITVYNISQDPRRYRQRVIFFYHQANYLLKMLWDTTFIKDTILNQHYQFATHFDPFLLKPVMILQSKPKRTTQQQIFLNLIKPSQIDMDKIVKCLIVLAQQQYDEDQQSRFINEKKNFGELQQRKKFIQKKREGLPNRQLSFSQKKINYNSINSNKVIPSSQQQRIKKVQFTNNKKSDNIATQIENVKGQRAELKSGSKVMTSLTRIKNIRSVDLKKISPYLSRSQLLKKAHQVVQFQHKFRLAHNEYIQSVKTKGTSLPISDPKSKLKVNQMIQSNKQISNNRIFNKYIEQNVRLLDEANKNSFLYKNKIDPDKRNLRSSLAYNKVSFHDRKQAQYQRNIQRYLPRQGVAERLVAEKLSVEISPQKKPTFTVHTSDAKNRKGTKNIIQISDRGIRAGEKIIQFELSSKKGKNLGSILQQNSKQAFSKTVSQKLSPQKQSSESHNLFQSQNPPQMVILRQQPQKLQQLKRSLYQQIKQQLLQQLKNNQIKKEQDLNNMIQEEKRRKISQIIQQRRLEEQKRKQEQERMRIAQLDKERKKINLDVKIQSTQYAEQNLDQWFNTKLFALNPSIFQKTFTNQNLSGIRQSVENQLQTVFLKGFFQNEQTSYCSLHYDTSQVSYRKFKITYLCTKQVYFYISTFHQICQYMWRNDPLEEIQIVMYRNQENQQGNKVITDVYQYGQRNGNVYEKELYSNVTQIKILIYRPQHYNINQMDFKFKNHTFGKAFNFRAELLSAAISLSERHPPQIDMNLQTFTNYLFLLQELFRSYLTPQQIVQLRQNSTNIRRLKDIFRIVLQMQKSNPLVDELTVVQGLNMQDLYTKLKQKVKAPYQKYYWENFYDRTSQNRLLLSILQTSLTLPFPITNSYLNDKSMFRLNIQNKILILRSSVYSKEDIYIINTSNPKIRMFFMQGENYKLMRIELFVFLNLVFNNIVEEQNRFVSSIWIPQFAITKNDQLQNDKSSHKKVKRITDFSISMKKSFFLAEEIYFCNHQYIKSGIFPLIKAGDIIFKQSMIFGMLHTDVQKASTGMPIYSKIIDRNEFF